MDLELIPIRFKDIIGMAPILCSQLRTSILSAAIPKPMHAATHNAAGVSTGSLVSARGCRQTVKHVEMTTRRRGQAEAAQGRCCRPLLRLLAGEK